MKEERGKGGHKETRTKRKPMHIHKLNTELSYNLLETQFPQVMLEIREL